MSEKEILELQDKIDEGLRLAEKRMLQETGDCRKSIIPIVGSVNKTFRRIINAHKAHTTNTAMLFVAVLGLPADVHNVSIRNRRAGLPVTQKY